MADDQSSGRQDAGRGPKGGLKEGLRRAGVVPLIVALALVLAIAFFYVAPGKHRDATSDAAIDAAAGVDNAARKVGDAAERTADKVRRLD